MYFCFEKLNNIVFLFYNIDGIKIKRYDNEHTKI